MTHVRLFEAKVTFRMYIAAKTERDVRQVIDLNCYEEWDRNRLANDAVEITLIERAEQIHPEYRRTLPWPADDIAQEIDTWTEEVEGVDAFPCLRLFAAIESRSKRRN